MSHQLDNIFLAPLTGTYGDVRDGDFIADEGPFFGRVVTRVDKNDLGNRVQVNLSLNNGVAGLCSDATHPVTVLRSYCRLCANADNGTDDADLAKNPHTHCGNCHGAILPDMTECAWCGDAA